MVLKRSNVKVVVLKFGKPNQEVHLESPTIGWSISHTRNNGPEVATLAAFRCDAVQLISKAVHLLTVRRGLSPAGLRLTSHTMRSVA